jgi:hypothetical protein
MIKSRSASTLSKLSSAKRFVAMVLAHVFGVRNTALRVPIPLVVKSTTFSEPERSVVHNNKSIFQHVIDFVNTGKLQLFFRSTLQPIHDTPWIDIQFPSDTFRTHKKSPQSLPIASSRWFLIQHQRFELFKANHPVTIFVNFIHHSV